MYFRKPKYFLFILFAFIAISLPLSCAKENPVDKLIPNVQVELWIKPGSLQYINPSENGNGNLTDAGHWLYVEDGYRGIIIFNTGFFDFTYKAFERTAPYGYPNDSECRVEVDESGWFAIDPCSNTRYSLFDNGYPDDQGPGTLPLKQYAAEYNPSTGYLHIYN